jgi:hypothetical protein
MLTSIGDWHPALKHAPALPPVQPALEDMLQIIHVLT